MGRDPSLDVSNRSVLVTGVVGGVVGGMMIASLTSLMGASSAAPFPTPSSGSPAGSEWQYVRWQRDRAYPRDQESLWMDGVKIPDRDSQLAAIGITEDETSEDGLYLAMLSRGWELIDYEYAVTGGSPSEVCHLRRRR